MAVVVTKLTGALLFILLLAMVIMALLPKADAPVSPASPSGDLAITTPPRLPDAVVGRPYSLALAARGAARPEWALVGALPEGLRFDPDAAIVSGTPARGTSEPARLVASVREGASRDSRALTLSILQPESRLEIPAAWSTALPRLPWRAWLEQGFGFLVLLLIHLVGINAVRGLERRAVLAGGPASSSARYVAMRWLLRMASLTAAAGLAAWLSLGA